jgi:hypothetical protein
MRYTALDQEQKRSRRSWARQARSFSSPPKDFGEVAKYVTKPGGYLELTREQWQCDDRGEQGTSADRIAIIIGRFGG